MPVIHKSTIKRARQAEKRHQRNRATISGVRNIVKKALSAVEDKNADEAKTLLREATSAIHKAMSKGVIKRNTASRRISRLTARINALTSPSSPS